MLRFMRRKLFCKINKHHCKAFLALMMMFIMVMGNFKVVEASGWKEVQRVEFDERSGYKEGQVSTYVYARRGRIFVQLENIRAAGYDSIASVGLSYGDTFIDGAKYRVRAEGYVITYLSNGDRKDVYFDLSERPIIFTYSNNMLDINYQQGGISFSSTQSLRYVGTMYLEVLEPNNTPNLIITTPVQNSYFSK